MNPTWTQIDVPHEGDNWKCNVRRTPSGWIATEYYENSFETEAVPAPVALVFAAWQTYAVARVINGDDLTNDQAKAYFAGISLNAHITEG